MENKSHAMAAGAFVLIVSALLVGLALWLTRDTTVSRTYELSSRESVTGLQPQAGVRFKGVSIGKVESIGFDPTIPGNVLIRISTDDSIAITRSAFGTLGFQGVTGLAFVQLDDNGESKDLLVSPNGTPRVFHSDQPTPAPRIAKVTPSDSDGDILTSPNQSATKIFEPMKTSSTANAYLR